MRLTRPRPPPWLPHGKPPDLETITLALSASRSTQEPVIMRIYLENTQKAPSWSRTGAWNTLIRLRKSALSSKFPTNLNVIPKRKLKKKKEEVSLGPCKPEHFSGSEFPLKLQDAHVTGSAHISGVWRSNQTWPANPGSLQMLLTR